MIPWLNSNFKHFKPTAAIAINATRHMNKIERRKLFSPDIEPMRTAEGRWFEAIVYEMFLDISKKSDTIKYLAMKGADAPHRREDVRLGQNGLFYSKYGDITIRGNGQDLAEFDMLLVDSENHIAFAEVVTSPADLKEFEMEIAYKKRLLGYLYSQKVTPFLLVSPTALPDETGVFTERACGGGLLGRFPSVNAMPLMLAHAGKLKKYGA